MKASIFTAQPGLERRCMWSFNCDNYSYSELAEIFFLKAKEEKFFISEDDKVKIVRLFSKNEGVFKNQGGDASKLVYLASLEATRSSLSNVTDTFLSTEPVKMRKQKILTYENVEKGLMMLKENKFD
jgi:hypothetical protein